MILTRKDLPILYGLSKSGKVKQWKILVEQTTQGATLWIQHGYQHGAKQTTSENFTQGKNLGKCNETTPFSQAVAEATSKWNKQHDKGYRKSVDELKKLPDLPMLANSYAKHKVTWPCYGQPKMNGVRCVAHYQPGQPTQFLSRNGKNYHTVHHLTSDLQQAFDFDFDSVKLDGELYHPNLPLQTIVSLVRREKADRSIFKDLELQYWIYDIIIPNTSFTNRYKLLKRYEQKCLKLNTIRNLVFVPTEIIENESGLIQFNQNMLDDGFEGSMIRNKNGCYIPNYRSNDLLKYKLATFQEDDFEIVGGTSAKGKDEGSVIFTCITKNNQEFSVRPKGSIELRRSMFDNLSHYVGKHLMCKYAEFTESGIPFHPVGLYIREEVEGGVLLGSG